MICEMNHIPYAAWIYDCPQNMLLSKTIKNKCNNIFCFDELYAKRLMNLGAQNVYHFPLAADVDMYKRVKMLKEEEGYACDISFVGGLYNGERNRLLKAKLSEYSEGYVDALLHAQKEICGYNLIADALSAEVAEEIVNKCELVLSESYMTNTIQMAADAVNMKLTTGDREEVLFCLAQSFDVTLYTNSKLPEKLLICPHLVCKGTVDYQTEMPLVFHNSKINLNITSRTIESGVSQRVFDILACGGFCLTNYQPEIAALFEDGKELVMYTDVEDMVMKAGYYLTHEEERMQIAKAGYEKVCNCFSIKDRIMELIDSL
jgi:spore maturation protein CgeB